MISPKISDFIDKMNHLASDGIPFLFIIDYNLSSAMVIPAAECESHGIFYNIRGITNCTALPRSEEITINKKPVPFEDYLKAFDYVQEQIHKGNSYLVNLTFPTPVKINKNLSELFTCSVAPYKLLYKDQFLVFSPESFVRISNGKISTFPMKGTIDASIESAEKKLLENEKETAEHATIVDLLRNDLSRVAANVRVVKYRYIDKIITSGKSILQMSSAISGDLPDDYLNNLGDIIIDLLPAGSICGAPKKATLEIIAAAEKYNRGFYTGIFGIFDGRDLDSGVMIRFIENQNGKMIYKSGGGITSKSDPKVEYQELIDKIYVPVN